jgi:hypothetical protein
MPFDLHATIQLLLLILQMAYLLNAKLRTMTNQILPLQPTVMYADDPILENKSWQLLAMLQPKGCGIQRRNR